MHLKLYCIIVSIMSQSILIIISIFSLCTLIQSNNFQYELGHLKSKSNASTQAIAALDLIKRLIPQRVTEFIVEIDGNLGPIGKDTFSIQKHNGVIKITATTGVAAAWGFHYYLKYFCQAHISWESTQLNLPTILPDVNISITANDRFRYYQNVCTTSYSFVWWNWNDWERHIDWMALNGINLALAFNGQEAIWRKVYQKFNLTENEIDEHFAGPAFLSWSRMGNIRGWGGPLPNSWHQRSLKLQKKILHRMRNFGIIPVLPAFAGHIPREFARLFPEAKITKMDTWNEFEDKYCCPYLLNPTDELFNKIGISYMQEQIAEFGTNHVYNCDTFNEMLPKNSDTEYLRNISRSIYSAMIVVDPKAIWILQNWLFVHEYFYWTKDRAKAFLTAVPKGRMIILDLQSEQFPQYFRLESYFGQPFIWCMLHNFGGTLGMFGSANKINTEVFKGRNFKNSTMIGTGLTPEGINQNYVIYDLMTEMSWRQKPANLKEWFKLYSLRRYGQENNNAIKAWNILSETVYDYNSIEKVRGKYVISRSPRLNIRTMFWYNITEFMLAWDYLLKAADTLEHNTGYRHDLVDVTRQVLQIYGDLYYSNLIKAFKKKKVQEFQFLQNDFIQIFNDLECILSTNEAFLLGKWLESAKSVATTLEESKLYEYNARNQISLWGPNGEINDYANKQWAGVVSHLFAKRWTFFLAAMNESLISGNPFNETHVRRQIFSEIETPFTTDTNVFPINATGDTITVAKNIYNKWRNKSTILTHKKNGRNQRSSEEVMPEVIVLK